MKNNGVFIENGPQDWQIIQRHDGKADIPLSGVWDVPDNWDAKNYGILVRIVDENTNRPVINWQMADTTFDAGEKSGTWKHILRDVPQGGLYRLETKVDGGDWTWGVRGDMRHHLGVGDIWVIIGQSNAAGYGKDHVEDAPQLGVHLLRHRGKWDMATHPFNESTDTVYLANREASNPGVCPYLNFGKMLKRHLNIPIGLIPASQGGSPICDWLTSKNGYLYRNMQKYLNDCNNDFAGWLWYQGCTDAQYNRAPLEYCDDFTELVGQLRKDYGHKPVLTTQLNKVTTNYELQGSTYERNTFGVLREQQRRAAHTIPDTYVVPSYDLTMSDEIHNDAASSLVIGQRLAEVALHAVYGLPGFAHSFAPDVASIRKIASNQTELTFDHCECLYAIKVPTHMMPFICEDKAGETTPIAMQVTGRNTMVVTWARDLADDAKISFVPSELGAMRVLFDQPSYLPPLSFYRVLMSE